MSRKWSLRVLELKPENNGDEVRRCIPMPRWSGTDCRRQLCCALALAVWPLAVALAVALAWHRAASFLSGRPALASICRRSTRSTRSISTTTYPTHPPSSLHLELPPTTTLPRHIKPLFQIQQLLSLASRRSSIPPLPSKMREVISLNGGCCPSTRLLTATWGPRWLPPYRPCRPCRPCRNLTADYF
jgi:hypothetical protein